MIVFISPWVYFLFRMLKQNNQFKFKFKNSSLELPLNNSMKGLSLGFLGLDNSKVQ
jgi:hypothetical protein